MDTLEKRRENYTMEIGFWIQTALDSIRYFFPRLDHLQVT